MSQYGVPNSGPGPIPFQIWDGAAGQAFRTLLSAGGAGRLTALSADLQMRRLVMRSVLVLVALFIVVQGILRPTGLWVLPKELLAYGVGIFGFWLVGALLGATLTLREVIGYAFFGFFVAPILTVVIGTPLHKLAGPQLGTGLVVPILEELIKLIPALFLVLSMRRDPRGSRVLYDFLLVGFASGAGFAVHEDVLWQRLLIAEGPLKFVAPWIYNAGTYLTGSHATWSALAALGIGVIVLFRGRKFTWIIGLVTFAVGLLEHMAWNYWGSYDFLGLLGAGRIPLAIFYLAWIAAGIHCIIVRAWGKQRDPLFPAPRLPFAGSIRHWPRQLDYTRLFMQAHSGWMRHRVFGAKQSPSVATVERLAIAAVDAKVLHVVAPVPGPPRQD